MKKIALGLLCMCIMLTFVACGDPNSSEISSEIDSDTISEDVSPISSSDEAIQIVKDLVGTGNDQYIFEFSNEDKVIEDNGNFSVNRDSANPDEGMDCMVIRVFTELKEGDSISQNNIGWYFVSKNNGKVFEMIDPYETKLKAVN